MKIQKHNLLIMQIAAVLLAMAGCIPYASIQHKTKPTYTPILLLTPIRTSTPLPKSTAVILPTLTFMPTLLPDREQLMLKSLQSNDCKLPCYLGITPGKTTLSEARAILNSLGASYLGEYRRKRDDGIEYPYVLVGGMGSEPGETTMPKDGNVSFYHHVSLITNNDIVQIIEVNTGTAGQGTSTTQVLAKFRRYWSRYTTRGIFIQMGVPDQLYSNVVDPNLPENGRTLFIVYEKHGAVIKLYGTGQENNICPADEARFINLSLILYNPSSNLNIYANDRTSQDLGLPIEEVVGVNTRTFFDQVMSNPSTCFQVK